MAYLKPGVFVTAVFNKLAMKFGIAGAVTLVIAGRKTGEPKKIPVIPVDVEGARYLVSTRGESEWVRNLRATGACELITRDKSQKFKATEVPVAERAQIIAAYRIVAGKTVDAYFAALPEPADHPIFRIE